MGLSSEPALCGRRPFRVAFDHDFGRIGRCGTRNTRFLRLVECQIPKIPASGANRTATKPESQISCELIQPNPTSSSLKTKLLHIKGIGCGLVDWSLFGGWIQVCFWGDDV